MRSACVGLHHLQAVRQRQLEEEREKEEDDGEEEEEEEDFHMAEVGGSLVTGKTDTLRFAKTSYRVLDGKSSKMVFKLRMYLDCEPCNL